MFKSALVALFLTLRIGYKNYIEYFLIFLGGRMVPAATKIVSEELHNLFSTCGQPITFGTHKQDNQAVHFICPRVHVGQVEKSIKENSSLIREGSSILKRGATPIFLTTDEVLWRKVLEEQF